MSARPDRLQCICTQGWTGADWDHIRRCTICRGRGSVTLRALAELTGEHRSTFVRLLDPRRRMRAETAARVLRNLVRVFIVSAGKHALEHLDPVPAPPPPSRAPVLLSLL